MAMKRGRDYDSFVTKFIEQYTDIWKENKRLKEDIEGYQSDLKRITNEIQIQTCGNCSRLVWVDDGSQIDEVCHCRCVYCGFIERCAYCDDDIKSKDLLEYQCTDCKK